MSAPAEVWLLRDGETPWSLGGRHTGLTDVRLTERGERQAGALGRRIADRSFAAVLTSPLARAHDTCRSAGFGDAAEVVPDLVEWDYGASEGRTTAEIRLERAGWSIWDHGARGGAYQQGTVWAWLPGPLALAHHRAHGDARAARAFLDPLVDQLHAHGVGSLAEVFDGDPPHRPRGCFAQAWSVAETLRAWTYLTAVGAGQAVRSPPSS